LLCAFLYAHHGGSALAALFGPAYQYDMFWRAKNINIKLTALKGNSNDYH